MTPQMSAEKRDRFPAINERRQLREAYQCVLDYIYIYIYTHINNLIVFPCFRISHPSTYLGTYWLSLQSINQSTNPPELQHNEYHSITGNRFVMVWKYSHSSLDTYVINSLHANKANASLHLHLHLTCPSNLGNNLESTAPKGIEV